MPSLFTSKKSSQPKQPQIEPFTQITNQTINDLNNEGKQIIFQILYKIDCKNKGPIDTDSNIFFNTSIQFKNRQSFIKCADLNKLIGRNNNDITLITIIDNFFKNQQYPFEIISIAISETSLKTKGGKKEENKYERTDKKYNKNRYIYVKDNTEYVRHKGEFMTVKNYEKECKK